MQCLVEFGPVVLDKKIFNVWSAGELKFGEFKYNKVTKLTKFPVQIFS